MSLTTQEEEKEEIMRMTGNERSSEATTTMTWAGAATAAAAGANCGHGQPQCPQGGSCPRARRRAGLRTIVSATLLAGFDPIEEAFGKVKGILRIAEARSRQALVEAMGRAVDAITSRDARGFFEHCGYQLQV